MNTYKIHYHGNASEPKEIRADSFYVTTDDDYQFVIRGTTVAIVPKSAVTLIELLDANQSEQRD